MKNKYMKYLPNAKKQEANNLTLLIAPAALLRFLATK